MDKQTKYTNNLFFVLKAKRPRIEIREKA